MSENGEDEPGDEAFDRAIMETGRLFSMIADAVEQSPSFEIGSVIPILLVQMIAFQISRSEDDDAGRKKACARTLKAVIDGFAQGAEAEGDGGPIAVLPIMSRPIIRRQPYRMPRRPRRPR